MDAPTALRPDHTTSDVAALVAEARTQMALLGQELAAADRLEREAFQLNASLLPWDPPQQKQQLWDQMQQTADARTALEQRVETIVSLLSQALERDPGATQPRARLAELHYQLFSHAEAQSDADRARRHLNLLALHDDGRYADLVEGTGTLQIQTDPEGAHVMLLGPQGEQTDLGRTPVNPTDVAPGSYVLRITFAGYAPTLRPMEVLRGADLQLQLRLFSGREVGPDFQFVPASRFTMGGDPDALCSGPATSVFVDNFAIARYPVTMGEYMLFLDDLASRDPGQALRHSPLPAPALDGHDPRLPVSGISQEAAVAYASWLSTRTGVTHRLPTEAEWEKAARGLDRRRFPWGDRFDPALCLMRRSRPGTPSKERVGSMPGDVSSYGVCDLAGGVSEWTSSMFDEAGALLVVRGGAYDDGAEACRCATRLPATTAARAGIGFRLVRPLRPGGGDRVSHAPVPTLPLELERPHTSYAPARLEVKSALVRVQAMARRLAADPGADPVPRLLAETVELLQAERGLLLTRELETLEARSAGGEPIPSSDQGFDVDVVQAALKQNRPILLGHPHPMLALPLPDGRTCLLLERRFHRDACFTDDCLLLAQCVADPLTLALRLRGPDPG